MIESELAINQQGERFTFPDSVSLLRVKQLRGGRGAPADVPDRENGGPLFLQAPGTIAELREAVETTGKYRLDAYDADGKPVPGVPAAYVFVTVPSRNASASDQPSTSPVLSAVDAVVRTLASANAEMMRHHTELAKQHTDLARAVAMQQPELIKASAEILRAADGAGLSRREPLEYYDESDAGDDDMADEGHARPPVFDPIAALQEVRPLLKMFGMDVDRFLSACGVRTASSAQTTAPSSAQTSAKPRRAIAAPTTTSDAPITKVNEEETTAPEPFVAESPVAHVLAIRAQLTPAEQAFVNRAMSQLAPNDLSEWRDRLARMPIGEAVAAIRAEIQKVTSTPEEK